MHFLIVCKFKKDWINSNLEKVETLILDIQGQLTLLSVFESGRNSKTSTLLWLSLVPVRMEIHSKMKALEWSQHFSHCKSK